jgi:hypothetical protein
MERPQSPRISADRALDSLGQFANQLAQGSVALPNISPDQGQGVARGVEAVGQGVSSIGQVLQEIKTREAEARAIADIHQAKLAFDQEAGNFAKWQESNPDPRRWEAEAQKRFGGLSASYLGGREVSKLAETKIKQHFELATQNQLVSVGVASAKATFREAREALNADYMRAIDAKAIDSAAAIAATGFQGGYWGEDDAVRMQLGARDSIENAKIKELQQRKDTAILNGDIESAKGYVLAMPLPEAEKELELAIVEKRHGYNQAIMDLEDMTPDDRIIALEGNRFGDPGNSKFSGLRNSDRAKLLDRAHAERNEERVITISGIAADIRNAGITDPLEIQNREDFQTLAPTEQVKLLEFITRGAQNDIAEFATVQRAVRGYDPANDPRGFEKSDLLTSIELRFDGARAEELKTILGERASGQGEPLSASSRVVTDIFSSLQRRFDAGELGGYRVTGDQINKRTGKNGEVFYTVIDPDGEHTQLGLHKKWNERVLQLSEDDVMKFESGKNDEEHIYEDSKKRASAYSRFLQVQETVDRKIKAGELTDASQIETEIKNLLGSELARGLDSRLQNDRAGNLMPTAKYGTISNGLFPSASDPKKELDNLLNAAGY